MTKCDYLVCNRHANRLVTMWNDDNDRIILARYCNYHALVIKGHLHL